ncbi:ferredoxin [Streptomyces sp. CB03578]|uniref:PDR/VanB family oxidoreductase n=1 Tax=Streptomyces sp. CB03578 TaxID=1718987 RepID=UPI000938E93B|nr:PDR/VanB family oxidoreductase [Streptomyces sp. CB03578]OKI25331.1 ferredoxin [Streptomyces sp. CB03578]
MADVLSPPPALRLRVQDTVREADGVLGLLLADPWGAPLPAWEPGAHLEVSLPSGRIRHYSLSGDPGDLRTYRLGVLRDPGGRGGSEEIHTSVPAGSLLDVRGPVNRFPLVPAERYAFIAGGIGITPLLPMVREAAARGAAWSLLYGGRTLTSMAYRDELAALGGGNLVLAPEDTHGRLDIDSLLRGLPDTAAVYCCGPAGLIAAVESRCAALFPERPPHVERFTAAPDTALGSASGPDEGGFEVELRRSGAVLHVPPGRSLLDVVREAVPSVPSSCEQGICGTCETKVLAGAPDHRDSVLSEAEKAAGNTMMICVGRSRGGARLVLDL